MVRAGMSFAGKTRLVILDNGSTERSRLDSAASGGPIFTGLNSILQDVSARRFFTAYIKLNAYGSSRVSKTTTLADLLQTLVEELDAVPQQCVTRMRRSPSHY
ncbi:hypothetical protein XENORESO_007871 [Xenotaenia resolanae]|uniref:Uncharacterized protein n=1 Tax=Xenotaenia resolanae TaxID=208358 RepID=A0ABV0X5Y6_9TELE